MSAGGAPARVQNPDIADVFLRALFLACSWTWVIGMWLPVYLINDFGARGWIAFAVPNVVGAAAVGLAHRTPARALAWIDANLGAARWFSVATVVFHVAFVSWLLYALDMPFLPPALAPAGGLAVALGGLALSRLGSVGWGYLAAAAYGLTVPVVLAALQTTGGNALAVPEWAGVVESPLALGSMAAALAFGFLLCPHLDLTLLRVRAELPGAWGGATFALGYGALFLALIGLTALYASAYLLHWFSYWIALHIVMQSTFTVGAHLRELRERGWPRALERGGRALGLPGLGLAALLIGLAFAPVPELGRPLGDDRPATRLAYEGFLWLYAAPFPALVALRALGGRRLSRGAWALFWAVALAGGAALLAGVLTRVWWLMPAGVVAMIAAAVAGRMAGAGSDSGAAPKSV